MVDILEEAIERGERPARDLDLFTDLENNYLLRLLDALHRGRRWLRCVVRGLESDGRIRLPRC